MLSSEGLRIAGIDEAGRGPLAGPVVAAAVVLKSGIRIARLRDSKKGLQKERESLYTEIQNSSFDIGIGVVEAFDIDRLNILQATKYAMHCAVKNLSLTPDVLVIDTRNRYEFEVGTFRNAVDPETDSFREFPGYARRLAENDPTRKLAMFCTGGIRCEKATALMLELGFEEVYHLQGGILRYLEEMPEGENRWQGECFVFDTRVAVDKDLAEGGYVQCHACRRPLSAEDLESPDYREGVSCPHCVNELDQERAARLEERRKQVALAEERGGKHIGQKISSR